MVHIIRKVRQTGLISQVRMAKILSLLADGLDYKEIALEMGVAPGTMKNYSSQVRDWMGADTNEQAVAMALRRNIIT